MAATLKDQIKGKNAAQLTDLLRTKSQELQEFMDKRAIEKDGVKTYDFTVAEIEDVRERNDELTDIGKAVDNAREVERIAGEVKLAADRAEKQVNRPRFSHRDQDGDDEKLEERGPRKTWGELIVASKAYQDAQKSGISSNTKFATFIETKATMTRAAGFAPANDRTDIIVPFALRRIVIQDLVPEVTSDLDSVRFMEETTFTNQAAERAEDTALPESTLAYTERNQPVELIGTFIPVTEQQLEVPEFTQAVIDNRLAMMYLLREESQLLNGDGTSPNLLGFLNKIGIQTQARGADPVPDTWYKLITKLRGGSGAGFVEPSAIVTHPNDWQDVRMLKDANGNYIWGNPAEAGPERMWGKPVVVTTAITENTGLTGDFSMFSQIYRKRQIRVEVGLQNDDFVKVKMTVRVTGRLALVIYRAAAFGTATGI